MQAVFEFLAYRMGVAKGTLTKRMKAVLKKREVCDLLTSDHLHFSPAHSLHVHMFIIIMLVSKLIDTPALSSQTHGQVGRLISKINCLTTCRMTN